MKFPFHFKRRNEREQELDDEIRAHLAMAIRERIEQGEDPDEAEANVRREFGNVPLVKDVTRDQWGWRWLETFLQDVRYGLRQLRRNPGFTIVAILTLALGIGANTAIFSVVYAVLLRPLPFKDSGRLVMLWEAWKERGENQIVVSPANFLDWKQQSKTLEDMTAMWWSGSEVVINGEPIGVPGVQVTRNFFKTLGVRPARGRTFSAEEQAHSGLRVAILSNSLWRRMGGEPTLIGKSIQLNREPYTVIGIMPPGFDFPANDEVWFPLPPDELGKERGNHFLRVLARLKPGVSIAEAQSEMDTIAVRLREAYPKEDGSIGIGVNVVSLQEQTEGNVRRALLILLAAVGCLLLIACANVANLMLARAGVRQREFAVRLALGASSWRVVRHVLTESTLLAVAGGALGAAWAYWGVRAFDAFDPLNLPRIQEVGVNLSMLLFTLFLAVSTGVLFGLAPALRSSRLNLNTALKDGSNRYRGRPPRTRASGALAVAQIALSVVLLTSAGLLLRSFIRRVSVPLGFRPDGVLAVELPWSVNPHIDELLERLRALPGVQCAGAATSFPSEPPGTSSGIEIQGRPGVPGEELSAGATLVTPGYFRAAGMTLLKGRFIGASDTATAPRVAVINQALAHSYFPERDPIGREISRDGHEWYTIVGVAGDTNGFGVSGEPMPNIYFSRQQLYWGNPVNVLMRTAVPPANMAGTVRKAIRSWNKNVAIAKLAPIEDLLADSVTVPRFYMLLVVAFATLALTLAAVGVYGLLSYSVAHRTHEFGVRMALGAKRGDLLRMILGQGLTLILTGIGLGLAGAWASTQVLRSLLFQIQARDVLTFVGACLVLGAVGLLACYIPARRAAKVDPMVALRYE